MQIIAHNNKIKINNKTQISLVETIMENQTQVIMEAVETTTAIIHHKVTFQLEKIYLKSMDNKRIPENFKRKRLCKICLADKPLIEQTPGILATWLMVKSLILNTRAFNHL